MYKKANIYAEKLLFYYFVLNEPLFETNEDFLSFETFFNGTKTSYMSKDQVKFDFSCHCALSQ